MVLFFAVYYIFIPCHVVETPEVKKDIKSFEESVSIERKSFNRISTGKVQLKATQKVDHVIEETVKV